MSSALRLRRVVPRHGACLWLALWALGCGTTPASAPRPQRVAPTRGAVGDTVALTISGESFVARVFTDFRQSSRSTVNAGFSARLQAPDGAAVPLSEVTLVDSRTMTATVPALTPRGLYDVVVVDPAGLEGVLPATFRIVSSAENVAAFTFDALEAQHSSVPFAVGLTAVDEVGEPVEGFDGTVTLSDPLGAAVPTSLGPFVLGRLRDFVTVGTVTTGLVLTASDALGHVGQSQPFDVLPGSPAQVAFAGVPASVAAGACAGPFQLEVRDTFGHSGPATADVSVAVTANPPEGVRFFSDPACGTEETSVVVPAGASQGTLFVQATVATRLELRAVPDLLPSAVQALDVDAGAPAQLAFASAAQSVAAGDCSQPVVVQTQDSFGNPAPVTQALPLEVTAVPSAGVTLHSDATCATALASLEIPAGQAQAQFGFRSTSAAMVQLSVEGPDGGGFFGVSQLEEVTP